LTKDDADLSSNLLMEEQMYVREEEEEEAQIRQ